MAEAQPPQAAGVPAPAPVPAPAAAQANGPQGAGSSASTGDSTPTTLITLVNPVAMRAKLTIFGCLTLRQGVLVVFLSDLWTLFWAWITNDVLNPAEHSTLATFLRISLLLDLAKCLLTLRAYFSTRISAVQCAWMIRLLADAAQLLIPFAIPIPEMAQDIAKHMDEILADAGARVETADLYPILFAGQVISVVLAGLQSLYFTIVVYRYSHLLQYEAAFRAVTAPPRIGGPAAADANATDQLDAWKRQRSQLRLMNSLGILGAPRPHLVPAPVEPNGAALQAAALLDHAMRQQHHHHYQIQQAMAMQQQQQQQAAYHQFQQWQQYAHAQQAASGAFGSAYPPQSAASSSSSRSAASMGSAVHAPLTGSNAPGSSPSAGLVPQGATAGPPTGPAAPRQRIPTSLTGS